MSDAMADRFRKWFKYEQDAHAKVVRSLESVPADRRRITRVSKGSRVAGSPGNGATVWLERLGVIPRNGGHDVPR